MKKRYYENIYLNALDTNNVVDVLVQSSKHMWSYTLLERVIDSVQQQDVVRLLDILLQSTYDLDNSGILKILYKYRFDQEMYSRFIKLKLKKNKGISPSIGIYNYCYFKIHNEDYSVDIMDDNGYKFLVWREDEYVIYRNVLKLICFYNWEDKRLHEYVKRYLKDDLLISILDENGCVNGKKYKLSDLMLVEHSQIYNVDELTKTILGLCYIKKRTECITKNDKDESIDNKNDINSNCYICGRRLKDTSEDNRFKVDLNILKRRLEEWLFLEDIEMVEKILIHCEKMRTGHILKVLLRIFLELKTTESMNLTRSDLFYNIKSNCKGNHSYCINNCSNNQKNFNLCNNYTEKSKIACIAKLIGLFEINSENEYHIVSFLKSCQNANKIALLVPQIMKTKELYFACFAAMAKCGAGRVAEIKFRGIVFQFKNEFLTVINDIINYFCHLYFTSTQIITNSQDIVLMELIVNQLAQLFSIKTADFLTLHFSTIFVIVYSLCRDNKTLHKYLTDGFIEKNHYHLVTRRILDGQHEDQVNDSDVMVELFFQRKFDLDTYFNPSACIFIRSNLSQLLFKIKHKYNIRKEFEELNSEESKFDKLKSFFGKCLLHNENNNYNLKNTIINTNNNTNDTVNQNNLLIFTILKHVFKNITISLYFNYIWPYVEYFINNERCPCASSFIIWLDTLHHSPLMIPYLNISFKSIEEFTITKGIENNLLSFLSNYFNNLAGIQLKNNYYLSDKDSVNHKHLLQNAYDINFISELVFMESFVKYFCSSRIFRTKILEIYPRCSSTVVTLFGHLGNDKNVLLQPPFNSDIPKSILVNFLILTDPIRQDITSFLIQQFLPFIKTSLDDDVEAVVGQFRHTRLQYRCGCTKTKGDNINNFNYSVIVKNENENFNIDNGNKNIDNGNKNNKLVSIVDNDTTNYYNDINNTIGITSILHTISIPPVLCLICRPIAKTVPLNIYHEFLTELFKNILVIAKNYDYMLHLLLLDNEVLCYATLCLLRVVISVNLFSFNEILTRIDRNTPAEILEFILRINPFLGKTIIPKENIIKYGIQIRDYYALIHCLESDEFTCYEIELLRLCYYMVGDYVRVQAITSTGKASASAGLFFELCIENNYIAAEKCLEHVKKDVDVVVMDIFIEIIRKKRDKNVQISKLLESIMNYSEISKKEFEQNPVYLHVLKDYQLLNVCKKYTDKNSCSRFSIGLILRCVDLITARRGYCAEYETILITHRKLAAKLQIPYFIESVELDYLRYLRDKKDYVSCYECLAILLGHNSYEALYEHALLKIDQHSIGEAKELLNAAIVKFKLGSDLFLRSILTLCKISNSSLCYRESITTIEKLEEEYKIKNEKENKENEKNIRSIEEYFSYLSYDRIKCQECNSIDCKHEKSNYYNRKQDIYKGKQVIFIKQKIYFYAAKHFEKIDPIFSLKYYLKAFNANYEAIPRFFHILSEIPKKLFNEVKPLINLIISEHLASLLPYYSQLCNKICIDHESNIFFQSIVLKLLEKYPNQTFWSTLYLVKSHKENTKQIIGNIIRQLSFDNRVLLKNTEEIAIEFIKISQSKEKTISLNNFNFEILFPTSVTVPGKSAKIHNIRDDIYVFHSLQCPKKIILIGSDGVDYPMIVKFKDDLRKDSRMMDLDILLNKLFTDSYYIRCYNVIPFTHDSGIIEYISDLRSLKDICQGYYYNINDVAYKFKSQKRIGLINFPQVLAFFPPIFNKYLKETFHDSFIYYNSRENYIKTYAIMCIVGWFIGLGDRHAENTHFDTLTGDTVHVDLNCIFDKAKMLLEIPERVPFRLTQNIINGFGILGTKGTFRHTMKFVLRIMKENKDAILANLLSFIFDPIFEWARKKNEPKRIIDTLAKKLEYEDEDELVDQLIDEAINHENLAAMYIGWMPFL